MDGRHTSGLEDTENLVTGDVLDLGDTVGVAEDDTDLRWGQTLLGQTADHFLHFLRGGLEPRGGRATVRDGGTSHTLSIVGWKHE